MDDFLSQALSTNSTSPLIEDILPIEDVDTDSCQLLGPVALAVQGVMGFIVIGGLLIKRMRERPRRKWKIWLADVGKQVVGQFIVHLSNVAISDLIASNRSDNPCSLYALNILIDTTLGVLLLYFLLQYSTLLMQRFQPLYKTGFYGTPFSMSLWAEQAAVYVGCLAVMKIVVLIIFWIAPELEDGMSWGLSWIENEEAQVVIVMLILPLVMNLFQFLMVDSIIRSKDPASPSVVNQESDEEALRRGFLETGSDDEDDDLNEERQQRLGNGNSAQQRSRDGEYEDVTGGDEDESGRQKQATELLFDADSPMVQQIPMMTMSRDNRASSKNAYPPTSVNLSSPLPPYSTLPPPDTLRESPGNSPKQTNRDSLDGEGKDDDGWGDQWDASSDIEEEEKLSQVPSPPSHPLASTSRSPPPLSPPAGSPPIPQPSQPRTRSSSPPASRFFSPDESGTSTPQRTPPRNPIADNTQWLANASAREREVESSQSTGLTAIEDHDQGRSDEEEADWGFSPPPVPPPELHVMPSTPSPRASGDFDWLSSPEIPPSILNQEPTTSIQSNRLEQEEKVRKDQDQEKEEEEEEEEEDLWGFDDSLSNDAPPSPVPSSLPDSSSAVEKVLGLNEAVVDVAPQIRAPSEVGKELGGLS